MDESKNTSKLRPPPRARRVGEKGTQPGSKTGGRPATRKRYLARVLAALTMLVGLIVVFVFLPRWQEQRERVSDHGTAQGAPPSPEDAGSSPQSTSPATLETISVPTPPPTAAETPRPAPVLRRDTPLPDTSNIDRQFVEAMSEGLTALDRRQWQTAQRAFERALRLEPDAPEVEDGLARAAAGLRHDSIAELLQQAQIEEQNEAWHGAEATFSAVLALDPESAPALEGRRRAAARTDLDEQLEFHLANPSRLSSAAVFDDASSVLQEALETAPGGPRLEDQIARLERALQQASTPVPVILESDDLTEVIVYRVGRLGTFVRRQLDLRPGTYTVVGSRNGYRDVRLQLVVEPGSPPEPLVVRCSESL